MTVLNSIKDCPSCHGTTYVKAIDMTYQTCPRCLVTIEKAESFNKIEVSKIPEPILNAPHEPMNGTVTPIKKKRGRPKKVKSEKMNG